MLIHPIPTLITWLILLAALITTFLPSFRQSLRDAVPKQCDASSWEAGILRSRRFKIGFLRVWLIIGLIRVGVLLVYPIVILLVLFWRLLGLIHILYWPESLLLRWIPLTYFAPVVAMGSSLPAALLMLLCIRRYHPVNCKDGTAVTLRLRGGQNTPGKGRTPWDADRHKSLIRSSLGLAALCLIIGCVSRFIPIYLPHPLTKTQSHYTVETKPDRHSTVAFTYHNHKRLVMMTDRGTVQWNLPPYPTFTDERCFDLQLDRVGIGLGGPYFNGVMGTFSFNGTMLTSFSGNQIQVRDSLYCKPQRILTNPEPVYSVAFSPDDKLLAVGGKNGGIVLWDVASWKQAHIVQSHGQLLAIVFSPDGQLLATGSSNGTITVWSTKSWKSVHQWRAFSLDAWNLVFSPDGKWLLGMGDGSQEDEAVVWDTRNWKPVTRLKESGIRGAAFSPDSKHLALSKYGIPDRNFPKFLRLTEHVWKTSDWTLEDTFMPPGRQLEEDNINHILFVAFTPESDGLTAENIDGDVHLWMLGGCGSILRVGEGWDSDACEMLGGGGSLWVFRPPNTPKGWRKI